MNQQKKKWISKPAIKTEGWMDRWTRKKKKNESLIHTTMWMNPENVMLGKRSQS